MASITLKASARDKAKKGKVIRREGLIPGTVYGPKMKNEDLTFIYQEFHKVYVAAGESTIVELETNGKKVPVLIHELQFDPMTGNYTHIDLFALDMTKEVTTNVPLRFVGEAPGVKEGGVLVKNSDHITVKCLPKDLPHDIEVDISSLVNFFDAVKVSDLKIPATIKIEEESDLILVSVIPPRKEEEIAPPVAAAVEGMEGAVAAEGAEGAAAEGGVKADDRAPKAEKKDKK